MLIPRWVDCERVTFKYGLGQEFIEVLADAAQAGPGLDRAGAACAASQVSPRDVVAAALPDPATLGERMTRPHLRRHLGDAARARTARRARPTSTTWSTTRRRCASTAVQAVVWQTAINPVVALELLDRGEWKGDRRARPRGVPAEAVPRAAGASTARPTGRWSCRRLSRGLARARGRPRSAQKSTLGTAGTGPSAAGCSSSARRRGFGLAREELLEVRPRDEHDEPPRTMPPTPIHSGSVMPRIGLDETFSACRSRTTALTPTPNSISPPISGPRPSSRKLRALLQISRR